MQEPLQPEEPEYAPERTGPNSFNLHAANTDFPAGSKQPVWGTSGVEYAPTPQGYPAIQHLPAQRYLVEPGTIDLSQRQIIDNNEGHKDIDPRRYGSEYSSRDRLPNGNWMSYPTIYGGKVHSPQEAFDYARQTGQHLGIYHASIPENVINEAETALHARPIQVNGKLLNGDVWASMKKRRISDVVKK